MGTDWYRVSTRARRANGQITGTTNSGQAFRLTYRRELFRARFSTFYFPRANRILHLLWPGTMRPLLLLRLQPAWRQIYPRCLPKQAILALVSQAGGDITKTRQAFENWFNDGMDRAAGWYKRKTQLVLFFIGLIIAVCLNVDSITIGRALWASPAFRSYAVAAAEQYAGDKSKTMPNPNASKDLAVLQSLALPIGYNTTQHPWMDDSGVSPVFVLAGWLLTAIAMTLGAPFWFDTLNKFMVARSTIKPQEKSGVEASKDA
jgi:hypothetical protein